MSPPAVARGVTAALPLVPSTVAWGTAFGAAAVAAGLPAGWSLAMSAAAWSGTAQLAVLRLLDAPLPAVFATSLLLSLRFVPMSLALAGMLPGNPRWRRVLAACCLADASFALLAAGGERSLAFVLGTWLTQYVPWLLGTAVGALAAPWLPAGLLGASDVLVAVIFAVLAVEACTSWPEVEVAALAAGGALAGALVLAPGVALPLAAVIAGALGALRRP